MISITENESINMKEVTKKFRKAGYSKKKSVYGLTATDGEYYYLFDIVEGISIKILLRLVPEFDKREAYIMLNYGDYYENRYKDLDGKGIKNVLNTFCKLHTISYKEKINDRWTLYLKDVGEDRIADIFAEFAKMIKNYVATKELSSFGKYGSSIRRKRV